MKNTSVAALNLRAASLPLECKVVVEPSSIDFLNEGSVFVAGSTSDCSSISPLPEQKKSKRRSHGANER
jgi:hypothetical protein